MRATKANEHYASGGTPRSEWLAAVDLLLEWSMPSEKQAAEWGVRAIESIFGRMTVPLMAESFLRRRLLKIRVHLYKFRVRYVGLNQLQTVYSNNRDSAEPWIRDLV